jgi:hypothetical protein
MIAMGDFTGNVYEKKIIMLIIYYLKMNIMKKLIILVFLLLLLAASCGEPLCPAYTNMPTLYQKHHK